MRANLALCHYPNMPLNALFMVMNYNKSEQLRIWDPKKHIPGSVACLVERRLGVQADSRRTPTSGTFFHEDLVTKIFL